jgi:hypothetical protein
VTGRELLEAHVRAFNHGVRHGDWEPMLRRFSEDACLRFENAPVGPYVGLDEIRRAYRDAPPDDEIRLLGVQKRTTDASSRRRSHGRAAAPAGWCSSSRPA